mmetsp:Transcript_14157/g.19376  ORF Transcript_14157/g.19376 Transcript_14157/m.19376 type:complete len:247 (-) Transcript_14157:181-921(-)
MKLFFKIPISLVLCGLCQCRTINKYMIQRGRLNLSLRCDGTGMNSGEKDRSDYHSSPSLVKFVVNTLTEVLKIFTMSTALVNNGNISNFDSEKSRFKSSYPENLRDCIVADFNRGYLFSGAIDFDIYDESCRFTDPTISFTGLSTFKRNIEAVRPLIDTFLLDRNVTLYSCQLLESQNDTGQVIATWRMSGGLKLFWNPRIELTGETAFTYQRKGAKYLVVDYFERWDIPPSTALLQLLQPGQTVS